MVVGDLSDAQRRAIEHGAALLVTSTGRLPLSRSWPWRESAGLAVQPSLLNTHMLARMIMLAGPCSALMDRDPLTVALEDLATDIANQVKSVDDGAAVVLDGECFVNRPGVVLGPRQPEPRGAGAPLVDHAEQAQSVLGVEEAEIVEILDHHHVGPIETMVPVIRHLRPGRIVFRHARGRALRAERDGAEPSRSVYAAARRAAVRDRPPHPPNCSIII